MFLIASLSSVNERSPLCACSSETRPRDAHFLSHRADLERHDPGGELVVRADLHVRPLEGLEALHADLERVEVGTDDREDEAPLAVRRRGQRIALGPARQRHRRAGQDSSLGVLHLTEDGRAGRLRGDGRCRKQTEAYRHRPAQGMATRSSQAHEALSLICGGAWPPFITSEDKQLGPNSGFAVSRDAKNEKGPITSWLTSHPHSGCKKTSCNMRAPLEQCVAVLTFSFNTTI